MKKTTAAEVVPTAPGTAFAGGIYAGRFFVGAEAFALVVAPKAEGELERSTWSASTKKVKGALSVYDGRANTDAMAAAGSALTTWVAGLEIAGQKDWYLPSRGELLLAYAAAGDVPKAEAFAKEWYWSSTQYAADESCAWYQLFGYGGQNYYHKGYELRARAVRRVKL